MSNENRDIFLIGDFYYDTYESSIYQRNNINSENFTNTLAGFNMYKLIFCRETAFTCCVSIEALPILPLLLAACVTCT